MVRDKNRKGVARKYLSLLVGLSFLLQDISVGLAYASLNQNRIDDCLSPKSILKLHQASKTPKFSESDTSLSESEVAVFESVAGTDNALFAEVMKYMAKDEVPKKVKSESLELGQVEKTFSYFMQLLRRPDYLPEKAVADMYSLLLENEVMDVSFLQRMIKDGSEQLRAQIVQALVHMDKKYLNQDIVNQIIPMVEKGSAVSQDAGVAFFTQADNEFINADIVKMFLSMADGHSEAKRKYVVSFFSGLDAKFINKNILKRLIRYLDGRDYVIQETALKMLEGMDKKAITPAFVDDVAAMFDDESYLSKEAALQIFAILGDSFVTPEIETKIMAQFENPNVEVTTAALKFLTDSKKGRLNTHVHIAFRDALAESNETVKVALGSIDKIKNLLTPEDLASVISLYDRNSKDILKGVLEIFKGLDERVLTPNALVYLINRFKDSDHLAKEFFIKVLLGVDSKLITQEVMDALVPLLKDGDINFLDGLGRYLKGLETEKYTARSVGNILDIMGAGSGIKHNDALRGLISRTDKAVVTPENFAKLKKLLKKTKGVARNEVLYLLAKADQSLITSDIVEDVFSLVKEADENIPAAVIVFLSGLNNDLMTQEIKDYFLQMLLPDNSKLHQDAIGFFNKMSKEQLSGSLLDSIVALLDHESHFTVSSAVQILHEMDETLYTQDIVDKVAALLDKDFLFLVNIAIAFMVDADDKFVSEDIKDKILALHDKSAAVGRTVSRFFALRPAKELVSRYDETSVLLRSEFEKVRENAAQMFSNLDEEMVTEDMKGDFAKLLTDKDIVVRQTAIEFFLKNDRSYITTDVKKDVLWMVTGGGAASLSKSFELLQAIGNDVAEEATLEKIADLLDSPVYKLRLFGVKLITDMDRKLLTDDLAKDTAEMLRDANISVCTAAVDFLVATEGKYISDLILSDVVALGDDIVTGEKVADYVNKMFIAPFAQIDFDADAMLKNSVMAVKENYKLNKSVSLPLHMVSQVLKNKDVDKSLALEQVLSLTGINLKRSDSSDIPVRLESLYSLDRPKEVMEHLYNEQQHDVLLDFMSLLVQRNSDKLPESFLDMLDKIADRMTRDVGGFYMVAYVEFFAGLPEKLIGKRYGKKLENIRTDLVEKINSGDEDLSLKEVFKIMLLVKDTVDEEELAEMFVNSLDKDNDFAEYLIGRLKENEIAEDDLTYLFKAVFKSGIIKEKAVRTQVAFYDIAGITEDEDIIGKLLETFQTEDNDLIKSSLATFFETYYEVVEDLFAALYPQYGEDIERFYELVPNLKYMECMGFRKSFLADIEVLRDFVSQLEVTKKILGEDEFDAAISEWLSLEDVTMILPLKKKGPQFDVLGYRMPHFFKGMDFRSVREQDNYAAIGFVKGSDRHKLLRKQYYLFQDKLINSNFAALELINANSKSMTKAVAFKIIELAETMADALYEMDTRSGVNAVGHLKLIRNELEEALVDVSASENIPAAMLPRINRLENNLENVHSVIRYVHQFGMEALTNRLQNANANTRIDIRGKKITFANLGDKPVVRNGKITNKPFKDILEMIEISNETYPEHPFIIIGNYLSWSCSLGEHRVELDCDLNSPDEGGFLRIRYFEGGDDIGNELRRHYLVAILKGVGMNVDVALSEDGHQYKLDAVFDKDHGAQNVKDIEYALKMALRSFHFTANLDWGFEAIVEQLALTDGNPEEKAKEIVADMADIYLAEQTLPFYIRSRTENDVSLYRRYQEYKKNEPRRKELMQKLNETLAALGYPQIPASVVFGQKAVNDYYIQPVMAGLARGELVIGSDEIPQINEDYDLVDKMLDAVTQSDDASMQAALTLSTMPQELFDFEIRGYAGKLAVVSGQLELDSGDWIFVDGLKDTASGKLMYASVAQAKKDMTADPVSASEIVTLLSEEGHDLNLAPKPSQQQKRVAERLLYALPEKAEKGLSVGVAASAGEGQWVTGKVSFNGDYHMRKDGRNIIFAAPFTTPDNLDAIKSANAVLTTGGGILSHAGITTREFGIPAAILPDSEWQHQLSGLKSLELVVDEKGEAKKDKRGFWVVRDIEKVKRTVNHNDIVMLNGKNGKVKVFEEGSQKLLAEAHALLVSVEEGNKSVSDVEKWILDKSGQKWYQRLKGKAQLEKELLDVIEFVFVTALGSRKLKSANLSLGIIKVINNLEKNKFSDATAKSVRDFKERFFAESFDAFESFVEDLREEALKITDAKKLENLHLRMQRQFEDIEYISSVMMIEDKRLFDLERKVFAFEGDLFKRFEHISGISGSNVVKMLDADLTVDDLVGIQKALKRHFVDKPASAVKNVMVVCTGNTCRSPIAEYMLKKQLKEAGLGDVNVISRGTSSNADDMNPISVNSEVVLHEEGITDFVHSSAHLSAEEVRDADLILTMGDSHGSIITDDYPDSADKVFRLNDFAKNDQGDISDPFGKDLDVYRKTGQQIKAAVSGVVGRLKTAVAYQKLRFREKELKFLKQQEIRQQENMVYRLSEVDDDYVNLVGGKSAKLGQIQQIVKDAGAYVPGGVAVATKAFDTFLKENGIKQEFDRLTQELDELSKSNVAVKQTSIYEYAAKIRELIKQASFNADSGVGMAILDALKENGMEGKQMAVRSSAVQEDTEEAAFAGAAETYLYVNEDDVLNKIKDSWMSFFLPRGIAYRVEHGITQSEVEPAVTVQEMVDAEKAGVIFTVNPVNRKEEVVINASYGLGESVVSGFVQGDMFVADKIDGEESEFPFIGSKRTKIIKSVSGIGTSEVAVSSAERNKRSLSHEEVAKLTKIAVSLENYFGYALDIEFAVNGDKIAILQARPVTGDGNDQFLKDATMTSLNEKLNQYMTSRDNAEYSLSPFIMQEKHLQLLLAELKRTLKISPRRVKGIMALSKEDIRNLAGSIKKLLKQDGIASKEEFLVIAKQIEAVNAVFAEVDETMLPKSVAENISKISQILVLLKSEEILKGDIETQNTPDEKSLENSYIEALKAVHATRTAA